MSEARSFPLGDVLFVLSWDANRKLKRNSAAIFALCEFVLGRPCRLGSLQRDWQDCRTVILTLHPRLAHALYLPGTGEAWIARVAKELGIDQVSLLPAGSWPDF